MAEVTATTLANGIPTKWAGFDLAANEEMVFANNIKEYDLSPGGIFNVPFIGAIAGSTQAAGSGGSTDLTYTSNTESKATMTPATRYAAVELEKQAAKRAVNDPTSEYKEQLQSGLAATIDADCLVDMSTLVTSIVNAAAGITKADMVSCYAKGAAAAKQYWKVGQTGVRGVIHPSQIDNVLNIAEAVTAYSRGDKENPVVSGWIAKAYGIDWTESGNVYTSGGVAYNGVYIPRAFGIAYNWRAGMEAPQPWGLAVRLIVSADFAHVAVRENYAVQLLSPST